MPAFLFLLCALSASAAVFYLASSIALPWAWLMWVALLPWLALLERWRTPGRSLFVGVLMAVSFVVAVFGWFPFAVSHFTGLPVWLNAALLVVVAPILQPQIVVYAVVRSFLLRRACGRLLVASLASFAWVGSEWLVPRLFEDTLGHSLYPFVALRQVADLAGAPALSLLIVFTNELLYAAWLAFQTSTRRALYFSVAAVLPVLCVAGYGELRLAQIASHQPEVAPLVAVLVQPNLSDYESLRRDRGTLVAVRTILSGYEDLSRVGIAAAEDFGGADLLVWPESAYPTTFGRPKSPEGALFDARITAFVHSLGTPLLLGTYDAVAGGEFNAAALLSPKAMHAGEREVFRKTRLFPLTEWVPTWLETPWVRGFLPWLGTWKSGDGPNLAAIEDRDGRSVKLAPLICLDAVDPSLALDAAELGAEALVTLSNDAWFGVSRGLRLHFVVTAFRSIETRLPQIRVTTTGISAVVDATGQLLDAAPVGEAAHLVAVFVPGSRGGTLMKRWGSDWFGSSTLALTLLGLVGVLLRPRSRPASRAD
jgi:apolipoprotein N-acyltransferase